MPITSPEFFLNATRHYLSRDPTSVRILDFGCGRGELVRSFRELGVDAYGCDIDPYWDSDSVGLLLRHVSHRAVLEAALPSH